MNIFATNPSAALSAREMCDKHLIKMILETAQIISTVAHGYGHDATHLYKPTHQNHPCTLWAASSPDNVVWLLKHGMYLCSEYTWRFERKHKTESLFIAFYVLDAVPQGWEKPPSFIFVGPAETPGEDVHERYQNYLNAKFQGWTAKGSPPVWTERDPPRWYKS